MLLPKGLPERKKKRIKVFCSTGASYLEIRICDYLVIVELTLGVTILDILGISLTE